MLFADLVIPAGVLIILVGVALMAVGVFVSAGLRRLDLSPYLDPFAILLIAILLGGGGALILLGIAKLFLP